MIGLHQGSVLSPILFIMLVDTISQDVRTELPWELLYADDLAIIDLQVGLPIPKTDWSHCRRSKQTMVLFKIHVANTEHLSTRENPLPMKLNGEELKNVDHFKL